MQKNFALWGRYEAENLFRPIERDHWLKIDDANASKLVDKSTGGRWHDVRFIPEIYAPNIHEFVDGLPLRRVFARVVLGDPESRVLFVAACKVAPCIIRIIAECRLFGPDQLLKLKDTNFLHARCSRNLKELAGKEVKLGAYPDLTGRKSKALLNILSLGKLLSDGFYQQDLRHRVAIDPELWTRPEYAIDLLKGDLVNIESGVTEWRAIVLRAPKFVAESASQVADATAVASSCEKRDGDEGDECDLMLVTEAAKSVGVEYDTLLKRATRQNVKKKTGLGVCVPRSWVAQQQYDDRA
ncbi:hypothetical protein C5688_13650 [Methylocystis sp. MitZ-2018]|nr:hypothetical protein C5688_13650 [Methylocystis sp. MitZ-2018]